MELINVEEVYATDADFACFHSYITSKEQQKVGYSDGVFKIIIESESIIESPESILQRAIRSLKNVTSQKLIETKAEDIYLYKKCIAKEYQKAMFAKDALQISSYSEETCCSLKLKAEGLQGLLNHYFQGVVKEQSATRDTNNLESQKRNLLAQGALLRAQFEDNTSFFSCNKQSVTGCSCPECQEDSCFDDSEDETGTTNLETIFHGAGITFKQSDGPILITKNLSLSRLKNILNVSKEYCEGISCPIVYVGKCHSFFALHTEVTSLWSINFLHFGHIKLWIVIPPHALLLLMFHLRISGVSLANTSCWNCLGHKTVFPSVSWLERRGIPFKVVIQRPGEAVVLYPNAAHYGFNLGWNFAEAINFGTVAWITEGINSPKCQCLPGTQVHVDMTELIAAFQPNLLHKYLINDFILTDSVGQMSSFLERALKGLTCPPNNVGKIKETRCKRDGDKVVLQKDYKSKTPRSKKVMECPVKQCVKTYPSDKKPRLVKHVMKCHKTLVEKLELLKRIEEQHCELKQKPAKC